MFEPWQLAMIDEAGYNGIRDEHIEKVAESLLASGLTEIDRSTFERHSSLRRKLRKSSCKDAESH